MTTLKTSKFSRTFLCILGLDVIGIVRLAIFFVDPWNVRNVMSTSVYNFFFRLPQLFIVMVCCKLPLQWVQILSHKHDTKFMWQLSTYGTLGIASLVILALDWLDLTIYSTVVIAVLLLLLEIFCIVYGFRLTRELNASIGIANEMHASQKNVKRLSIVRTLKVTLVRQKSNPESNAADNSEEAKMRTTMGKIIIENIVIGISILCSILTAVIMVAFSRISPLIDISCAVPVHAIEVLFWLYLVFGVFVPPKPEKIIDVKAAHRKITRNFKVSISKSGGGNPTLSKEKGSKSSGGTGNGVLSTDTVKTNNRVGSALGSLLEGAEGESVIDDRGIGVRSSVGIRSSMGLRSSVDRIASGGGNMDMMSGDDEAPPSPTP